MIVPEIDDSACYNFVKIAKHGRPLVICSAKRSEKRTLNA